MNDVEGALRSALHAAGERHAARLPSPSELIRAGRRARKRRRAAQVGGTFTALALIAAGGFALRPDFGSGALPASSHATSTTYPQVSQSEAISLALAGLPKQDFAQVKLVPDRGKRSATPLLMHVTMNVDSKAPGADRQALWESCLAEAAIAEHIAGDDATDLSYVLESVGRAQFPDGSTRDLGGCGGTFKPGRIFGAQGENLSDHDIVSSVDAALAGYGLTPDDVHVLRPLGPAVSVVATVEDVQSIKGQFGAIEDAIMGGDQYRYEGIYLEIRGPGGKPLAEGWDALRAGAGGVWFRPGMDTLLGIIHGHAGRLPGTSPPLR